MTSLTVDIKVLHNDIQRRFSLGTQAPTWNTLAKQIHNRFVLPEDYNLALGYLDEDGETVVISSTKELAEVWPVVTEDDERDLDSLPPLRFTIVHLPGLPVPSDSAERDGTPTLGGSASMSPDRDAEPDARDSGESKPAAFRDNLRAFIDAVKSVIDGDNKIKSALDKLVQHNGKQPTGGEDRDERDDFIIVAEEIERFAERGADKRENALSAGIITALLLPAFADAHPPPPPHHPPQHGRPHHDPFPHPPGPHHGHPGHGPTHGHPHGPPPPPPHGRHPGPPGGHHGRGSHGRKHPHGPPGPPPHPKHGDHPFPPYGFGRHPFGMMPHWGHACPRKRCACAAGLGDESSASSDSDSSDSEASDGDAEDPHFGFFGHRPYGFSRPHTGIERFPWPGPAHGPGGSARTSFHGHDRHGPAHGPFPDHGPGHKSRRGPPGPPHGRGRHGGRGGPSHPPPPPPGPAPSHGHPGHHAPHGGPPQHYPRPGGRHDRPGKWGWGWAA